MADTPVEDSYVETIEASNTYFSTRLGAAVWTAASADDKAKALQMATKTIDQLPLSGKRYLTVEEGQTLEFPRTYLNSAGGYSWDEDDYNEDTDTLEVPLVVVEACCEVALALIKFYSDTGAQSREQDQAWGVTSITLGEVSETYASGIKKTQFIDALKSPEAFRLLERYISESGAMG